MEKVKLKNIIVTFIGKAQNQILLPTDCLKIYIIIMFLKFPKRPHFVNEIGVLPAPVYNPHPGVLYVKPADYTPEITVNDLNIMNAFIAVPIWCDIHLDMILC